MGLAEKIVLIMLCFFAAFCLFFDFSVAGVRSLRNVGFAQNSILYSKEPFFAGDKIRIYAVVFNGSGSDVMGIVKFYTNGNFIGQEKFSASSVNRIREVWVDWTAVGGDQKISAEIFEAKLFLRSGQEEIVKLEQGQITERTQFVDFDTDKDGMGDRGDSDDDGDGLSDSEELKIGTNPLNSDTDGDGLKDNEDSAPLRSFKNDQSAKEIDGQNTATSTQKIIEISQKAADFLIDSATAGLNSFNNFTDKIEQQVAVKKQTIQNELTEIRNNDNDQSKIEAKKNEEWHGKITWPEDNQVFKKYFAYFALALADTVLKTKLLLYILIVLAAYFLFIIIFRKKANKR